MSEAFDEQIINEDGQSETTELSKVESKILCVNGPITLNVDGFGIHTNPITEHREIIRRYTWKNEKEKFLVQVMSYGATILKIETPDRNYSSNDVILGFDTFDEYLKAGNTYFGATCGRVCNIIKNGEFFLNEKKYLVPQNNDPHCYNGGFLGFDKVNWVSHVENSKVIMTHVSPDGTEGFPGTVIITATFEVLINKQIKISYSANTTKITPINITVAPFFNLAGHEASYPELYKHITSINADKVCELDIEGLPTGKILCVGGTLYDFRIPRELGPIMTRKELRGYDDNLCITHGTDQTIAFVARVIHPNSGRSLELYSNQPGVQFYTGNYLPDPLGIITPAEVNLQYFYYEEPHSGHSSVLKSNSESSSVKTENKKNVDSGLPPNEEIIPSHDSKPRDIGSNGSRSIVSNLTNLSEIEEPTPAILGKGGAKYYKHGGFCFLPQKYPDSVHHEEFPSIILCPGETYNNEIIFKFGIHVGPNSQIIHANDQEDFDEGENEYE